MIARVNDESFEKIESVEREVETFGELRRSTTEDAIELCAFKGEDFDAVTPLYYYDTRWHDPQTGQFLNTDPGRLRRRQTQRVSLRRDQPDESHRSEVGCKNRGKSRATLATQIRKSFNGNMRETTTTYHTNPTQAQPVLNTDRIASSPAGVVCLLGREPLRLLQR